MPTGACCYYEGLRWCVEVYHTLHKLLKEKNYDFSKKVFLSDSQKKIFPGGNICQECEESLREIEIYI